MVREEDLVALVRARTQGEELVAGLAGGLLDGDPRVPCPARHVLPRDGKREFELLGQRSHEGRIVAGEESAQLVVQVAEDELGAAGLEESVQQGDRVPSARDAEEVAAAEVEPGIEREHARSLHVRVALLNPQGRRSKIALIL